MGSVLTKRVKKLNKLDFIVLYASQHETANTDRVRHVVDISGLVVYIEECGLSV